MVNILIALFIYGRGLTGMIQFLWGLIVTMGVILGSGFTIRRFFDFANMESSFLQQTLELFFVSGILLTMVFLGHLIANRHQVMLLLAFIRNRLISKRATFVRQS